MLQKKGEHLLNIWLVLNNKNPLTGDFMHDRLYLPASISALAQHRSAGYTSIKPVLVAPGESGSQQPYSLRASPPLLHLRPAACLLPATGRVLADARSFPLDPTLNTI